MKVKVYEVNTTIGKRYGLMNANNSNILTGATAKWATAKGAEGFAAKMGFELVK